MPDCCGDWSDCWWREGNSCFCGAYPDEVPGLLKGASMLYRLSLSVGGGIADADMLNCPGYELDELILAPS